MNRLWVGVGPGLSSGLEKSLSEPGFVETATLLHQTLARLWHFSSPSARALHYRSWQRPIADPRATRYCSSGGMAGKAAALISSDPPSEHANRRFRASTGMTFPRYPRAALVQSSVDRNMSLVQYGSFTKPR